MSGVKNGSLIIVITITIIIITEILCSRRHVPKPDHYEWREGGVEANIVLKGDTLSIKCAIYLF